MGVSMLAPGVARFCDSGLRTGAAHPTKFSDAERRSIRYGSTQPCSVPDRINIKQAPPTGYLPNGTRLLSPAIAHFIRREDLQALHANDSGHEFSDRPLQRIDIGRDPLGGPRSAEDLQRSFEFEPIQLRSQVFRGDSRHLPWDPCQY